MNRLYKLLVADDEPIVIDSIRFIVERSFANLVLIASANNGKEAIEKVEITKPDIVVMDIRMPGIDGIEAIKEIKKRHPDILFIILTAYDCFSYAQEALHLYVLNYLVKPINKQQVIQSLQKGIEILDQRMQDIRHGLAMKEKFDKLVTHLENEFIYSSLLESEPNQSLDFYQEVFNMDLHYGYVMVLNAQEERSSVQREENMTFSIRKHEFFQRFRLALKSRVQCLVGAATLNREIAFIPVAQGAEEYVVRNRAIALAEEIINELDQQGKISFVIGIGRPYNVENFIRAYEEADKAVKLAATEKISHISDTLSTIKLPDLYPLQKEKMLVDKVIAGDASGVSSVFEELFAVMQNVYTEPDSIKHRLMELAIVIVRALSNHGVENVLEQESHLRNILQNDNISIVKTHFLKYLMQLVNELRVRQEEKLNKVSQSLFAFIHENYDKDIKLNNVAQQMNMSYHYFSKFFKEKTGQNFTDFLSQIRIGKAKEFLKDESYSIKEICYKVGYKDPNYFSKIFRKFTGITPSEYRELQV